ncbi:MAG: glycosyltransferase family protein [Schwartzia succinivorans]|nr:glycosyltransferase family protein [Schwartzia succinivorans]
MDEKKIDKNKICFISCVNNDAQYNECLESWKALHVPEGMKVESLVIRDAESMTDGYQAGMESSDAKYKIYIHQDVWINNKNLLIIMVREFQKHPEYGILGVVGSQSLPLTGVWWEGEKIGAIRDRVSGEMSEYFYERNDKECTQAIALDGLILMTQYDVDWRVDLFDKWHFYDVSQCVEFLKRGYKAAVLPQSMPLCTHFAGMNPMNGYDTERQKFLKEYIPFLKEMYTVKSGNEM